MPARIKVILLCALTFMLLGCMRTKTIINEGFRQETFDAQWLVVNGEWIMDDGGILTGSRNEDDWTVLLSRKTLPENYILQFSVLIDEHTHLFEVITNFRKEKYLGILFNQLDKRVAIEDRSLFLDEKEQKLYGYIKTTGNVGKLRKVAWPKEYIWRDIKIQRIGEQIFVWINEEPYTQYIDHLAILNNKGQFGFAINGTAKIEKVRLIATKGYKSLVPENFKPKPAKLDILFLFSE